MDELASVDVTAEIDKIDGALPAEVLVSLKTFLGKNARSIKVLRSDRDAVNFKGKYQFEAKTAPPYVRAIRLYGPSPEAIAKLLSCIAISPSGESFKAQAFAHLASKGYAYANIQRVISGFEIQAKAAKAGVLVTKIEMSGHPFSAIESAEDKFGKLLRIKEGLNEYRDNLASEVAKLESSRSDLVNQIELLTQERQTSEENGESAAEKLEKLQEQISVETTRWNKLVADTQAAENNKAQLGVRVLELNKEIGKGELELRQLIEKRRLISDEFSSFVEEGRGQAKVYGLLSIVPALMASAALGSLIYGGWTYAKLVMATPTEAYTYFLQRLPYTGATIVIVGLLLEILKIIIRKVMKIHEERLALARLLVVARDATYAAASDLEMGEDEIFKERMKIKMQLLKAHLGLEKLVVEPVEDASNNALSVE